MRVQRNGTQRKRMGKNMKSSGKLVVQNNTYMNFQHQRKKQLLSAYLKESKTDVMYFPQVSNKREKFFFKLCYSLKRKDWYTQRYQSEFCKTQKAYFMCMC